MKGNMKRFQDFIILCNQILSNEMRQLKSKIYILDSDMVW